MVAKKTSVKKNQQSTRHDKLVTKVNIHLKENDLPKAYPCLEELAALPESCSETSTTAGLVALTLDYRDKAGQHFLDAIKLSPHNFDANYNLFLLHLLNEDHVSAKSVIDRLIELFPQNSDLYSDRAILWSMNNEPIMALKDFMISLDLNPNSGKVLNCALSYLHDRGMRDEELNLLEVISNNAALDDNSRLRLETWRQKITDAQAVKLS